MPLRLSGNMAQRLILCLLTCGPLALTLAAWAKLYRTWHDQRPRVLALVGLGVVSFNSAFAAATFLYYSLRPPSPSLPPWQDPEILNLGLLSLLAPIGMIFGCVAAAMGAPQWLVWAVLIASVPLLVVGVFAAVAV
jgi:hypothetical protein